MVGLQCLYSHPGMSQVPFLVSRWHCFSDFGTPAALALALAFGLCFPAAAVEVSLGALGCFGFLGLAGAADPCFIADLISLLVLSCRILLR